MTDRSDFRRSEKLEERESPFMKVPGRLLTYTLLIFTFAVTPHPQTGSALAQSTLGKRIEVPLLLEGSRASISVLIDGRGPYRLDLDTGFAGQVLVSKRIADQLVLKPAGFETITDPSGKNPIKIPRFKLGSLQVGTVSFPNVKAGEDMPMAGPGPVRDGVIGLSVFQKYLLTLDYPQHYLSLSEGDLKSAPALEVVPFRFDHGIPTITLTVGQASVEAHVDTGGMGLSVPTQLAKQLPLKGSPVPLGRVGTASEKIEITGSNLGIDVHVAKFTFVKPFIEINSDFPMATLGSIPLSHFRLTFDQAHRQIRFEARTEEIELKMPQRRVPPSENPQ